MNKKGFTIIEIIICLGIITLIGTICTVVLVKNNKDKNIEKITNIILDAAKVFANVEKDEDGNNYISEIEKGRGGVKIPLSILVNKGYVKKEDANVIYNEYKDTKVLKEGTDEDYYVLLLDGRESETDSFYCENNQYQLEASWKIDAGKTLYLCNKKISNGSSSSLRNLLTLKNALFFNYPDRNNYKDEDRGLYVLSDSNGYSLYFYGNVDNNYLKFAGKTWRIVRVMDDGSVRVILDDSIEITAKKAYIDSNDGYKVKSTNEDVSIENLPLRCVSLSVKSTKSGSYLSGDATNLCFYNYQATVVDGKTVISKDSILIYPDSSSWLYQDYRFDGNLFKQKDSGLLKLTTNWYNNTIDDTDKENASLERFCLEERDIKDNTFACKSVIPTSIVGIVPLLSKKDYYYAVGYASDDTPYSYLFHDNVDFFLNDIESASNLYYYKSDERKLSNMYFGSRISDNSVYEYEYLRNLRSSCSSCVWADHGLKTTNIINKLPALRPVINLKSGLCFKGEGTASSPYEIIDGECN